MIRTICKPVEIHHRLDVGLLEQINIIRPDVADLADDQIGRIPATQT